MRTTMLRLPGVAPVHTTGNEGVSPMGGIIACASNGRSSDESLRPVQEGGVSVRELTFVALVGLPLLVAACLGLFFRSLIGWGRTWPLWAFAAAVLTAAWLYLVAGTP